MIVDNQLQIAVCTPPKCGTTSIEKMAKRQGQHVVAQGLGRHGCVAPPEAAAYTRLIMCRHPWARFASVWRYVASRANEFDEGPAVREMTLPEYAVWWEARRRQFLPPGMWQSPWVTLRMKVLWYVTQGDFIWRWGPQRLLRVEHLADDLAANGINWGETIRTNTTDSVKAGDWWDHYDDATWNRVGELFAEDDATILGYSTEKPGVLGLRANDRLNIAQGEGV